MPQCEWRIEARLDLLGFFALGFGRTQLGPAMLALGLVAFEYTWSSFSADSFVATRESSSHAGKENTTMLRNLRNHPVIWMNVVKQVSQQLQWPLELNNKTQILR